jgi:1-acyl-sn-glycerol-3-phosphate acyltransferase
VTSLFLRLYLVSAYVLSWLVFGAVGLALNGVCAVLLLVPGRRARAAAVRRVIHRLFAQWVDWLRLTRLFTITWSGAAIETWPQPAVYVANHPSLIDATLLLARLPNAICIFKPALRRNPFLAPAAIMAGYVSGDAGIDLIHEVAPRVAAGANLLVFPEGTRTRTGLACNPLRPGFALVAQRAGVPVQVLVIQAPRDLLPRGRPLWRLARLPARINIHVGRRLAVDSAPSLRGVVQEVEACFREHLESEGT